MLGEYRINEVVWNCVSISGTMWHSRFSINSLEQMKTVLGL